MKNNAASSWKAWGAGILAFAVIATGYALLRIGRTSSRFDTESLARCLSERGAVMYGTKSCPYCQTQRLMFGHAFAFVTYTDCIENPQECIRQDIRKYPTWKFASGETLQGIFPLDRLASESGCPLVER